MKKTGQSLRDIATDGPVSISFRLRHFVFFAVIFVGLSLCNWRLGWSFQDTWLWIAILSLVLTIAVCYGMAVLASDAGPFLYRLGLSWPMSVLSDRRWTVVALNKYAVKLIDSREYARAISVLNRVLHIAPGEVDSWKNRGIAHSSTGDHRNAIKDYTTALEIDGTRQDIYESRGAVFFESDQYEKALNDLWQVDCCQPDHAEIANMRAQALFQLGDIVRAKEQCELALFLRPGFVTALHTQSSFAAHAVLNKSDRLSADRQQCKVVIVPSEVTDLPRFVSKVQNATFISVSEIEWSVRKSLPLDEWTLFADDHNKVCTQLNSLLDLHDEGVANLLLYRLQSGDSYPDCDLEQCQLSPAELRHILKG